jgi:hypothetical protein
MESDSQSMSMLKDELVKTFPGLEIEEHGDLEGFIIKSAVRNSLGWLDPLYTVYVASHGYSGFRAINDYRKGMAIEDEKELIVNRTLREVMTVLQLDFRRVGGILPTFPTVEEMMNEILFGDIHEVPYDGHTRPAYVKDGNVDAEDLEAQTREAIAATLLYRFKNGRWACKR